MSEEQNGAGERAAVGTAGRIGHWTQKLLDFSARNRLLNIPQKSRQVVVFRMGAWARWKTWSQIQNPCGEWRDAVHGRSWEATSAARR